MRTSVKINILIYLIISCVIVPNGEGDSIPDITTAVYDDSFTLDTWSTATEAVYIDKSETHMYVVDNSDDVVHHFTLSTPGDVTTASYSDAYDVTSREITPTGVYLNDDGTKLFVVGSNGDSINEFDLSTAWNVSSASFVDSTYLGPEVSNIFSINIVDGGEGLYIYDYGSEDDQYSMTSFDASTASFIDDEVISGSFNDPWVTEDAEFYIEVQGADTDKTIIQYDMPAGDINSVSETARIILTESPAASVQSNGIILNQDYTKMWVWEASTSDVIYQYDITPGVLADCESENIAESSVIDYVYLYDESSNTAHKYNGETGGSSDNSVSGISTGWSITAYYVDWYSGSEDIYIADSVDQVRKYNGFTSNGGSTIQLSYGLAKGIHSATNGDLWVTVLNTTPNPDMVELKRYAGFSTTLLSTTTINEVIAAQNGGYNPNEDTVTLLDYPFENVTIYDLNGTQIRDGVTLSNEGFAVWDGVNLNSFDNSTSNIVRTKYVGFSSTVDDTETYDSIDKQTGIIAFTYTPASVIKCPDVVINTFFGSPF